MILVSQGLSSYRKEEISLHLINMIEKYLSREGIKGYMKALYKYYVNKGEIEHFSFFHFQDVVRLPMLIGKTMFSAFDTNRKGFLSQDQFVDNVNCLFAGSLEEKIHLASRIFDLDSDDIITIEDVQLIFYHFHFNLTKSNLTSLDEIISNFFENNTKLTVLTFRHITQTANSDIVLLMILFLSKYCPFSVEKIKFFLNFQEMNEKATSLRKKNGKYSKICVDDCLVENTYMNFFHPSEQLLIYINDHFSLFFDSEQYSELACLETFENDFKNVIGSVQVGSSLFESSNSPILKKIHQKDSSTSNSILSNKLNNFFVSRSIKSKISSPIVPKLYQNKNVSDISNFALSTYSSSINESSAQNVNIEINAFHMTHGGHLKKSKLVLIEDSLFYFTKSAQFTLKVIIPLKSVKIKEMKEVVINDHIYYPFQIVPILLKKIKKILLIGATQKEVRDFISGVKYENPKGQIKNDYEIGEEIGKGKFGVVMKCTNRITKELCAVKVLDKSQIVDDHTLEMVKWEVDIFHFFLNASHPGIIQSKNYYETFSRIFLVFELGQGGDLFSAIKTRKYHLTHTTFLSWLSQLVDAISYLQKFGIVHRDIKPQNILLKEATSENVQLKLIDFGLSKVMGKFESTKETHGSLVFASPEIILGELYSQKADIWSFGVIIYYLVYGKFPFYESECDSIDIAENIIKCRYQFSSSLIRHLNDKDIQALIKGCLKKEKWRNAIEQVEYDVKKLQISIFKNQTNTLK